MGTAPARADISGVLTKRSSLILVLLAVGATGCATGGVYVPQPFPRPGGAPAVAPDAPPRPADRYAITATALSLRGVPYGDGGASPDGFDCSGFTHYVFGQHRIDLPRLATDQCRVGSVIGPDQIQPGDLVFFSTIAPGASHVGVALGGDEFVHAPSERGEVRVERLSARYWSRRYVGARRVVETWQP